MATKISGVQAALSRCIPAVLLLVVTAAAQTQPQTELAGRWAGVIKLPTAELAIEVNFRTEGDGFGGDISIPAQGAANLPLAKITAQGANVSFDLPSVPGSPAFSGRVAEKGDKIAGEFSQGGQTFPFELTRGGGVDAARKALEGFDGFVEQARKDWKVPGFAIAVVYKGDVVFAQGFGQRDVGDDLPVTPQTLFAIGSATKAFTTFSMGTLVDEGKLDWDRPVMTYLPSFQLFDDYATTHMTPRDLVTHRSGLPRHDLAWYNNKLLTREQMVQRLRHYEPNKQLRETFQYNNMMFLTAGYLVERLTGGTWEQAVQSRILEPLEMKRTNFSVAASQQSADFALPYEEKDDQVRRMNFRPIDNVGPAGSINSCLDDMTRWLIVQLEGGKYNGRRLLSDEQLREMHTPQITLAALPEEPELSPTSYGLGWFIRSYRGHLQVEHGGAIDGFLAAVTLFPNDRLGVVAFANMNGSAMPTLMMRHAADRILELPFKDWNGEALKKWHAGKKATKQAEAKKDTLRKPDTRPSYALKEYAGEYEHGGYGVAKIDYDGERLILTFNDIVTPLEHWHYDVFNGLENKEDTTFENMRAQFLSNLKGDIDRLELPLEPMLDPIVFHRKPDVQLSDPDYLRQFLGVYELAEQEITIGLQGNTLTVSVPGQPLYELAPDRNNEFNFRAISGFSIRFQLAADGSATAFLNQPNGVFEIKRKAKMGS